MPPGGSEMHYVLGPCRNRNLKSHFRCHVKKYYHLCPGIAGVYWRPTSEPYGNGISDHDYHQATQSRHRGDGTHEVSLRHRASTHFTGPELLSETRTTSGISRTGLGHP